MHTDSPFGLLVNFSSPYCLCVMIVAISPFFVPSLSQRLPFYYYIVFVGSFPLITIFHPQQIPHSLFREQGYDHREALFGMPSYGGSIAQNVYYSQSTLCDANVDTSSGVPARETDSKTGKMKPWPSPYILMVDRGDCTFVQKVRCEFAIRGILHRLSGRHGFGCSISSALQHDERGAAPNPLPFSNGSAAPAKPSRRLGCESRRSLSCDLPRPKAMHCGRSTRVSQELDRTCTTGLQLIVSVRSSGV